MPRALPLATRQEIVDRHNRGQTLAHIASELAIPYVTVRAIWRAFRDHGPDGLVTGYHACGSSTAAYPQAMIRRACRLRRAHPKWGAGRIRVELLEHHKPATVPSVRVLQRAFQQAGINRPRRRQRPVSSTMQATSAHEVWQVDAVEKARLQTGAEVSWMAVTDQFTGAMLANELPPPAQWQSITPNQARTLLRRVFQRWGLPERIQVDNGHPWGLNSGLPPDLALWLLGLGVRVDWIPPGQPQKNGTVERDNGVMQMWADPKTCRTRGELKLRLQREALIQRERYPSIAGMSRMEAYPELRHSGRPYDPAEERQMWDLARVYQFLAAGVYHRRANPREVSSMFTVGVAVWAGLIAARRSSCVLTPDHESGLLATIKARS